VYCAEQILLRDSASLSVEVEHALRALVSPRGRAAALGVQSSAAAAEHGLRFFGSANPPSGSEAAWALVVGCFGFFFENYATGGLDPAFAVWRYDPGAHARLSRGWVPLPFVGTAPWTAFLGYFGTGLSVFGAAFCVTAARAAAGKRA
jgi:hypothetical protein